MSLISQLKRALQELTNVFYLLPGDEARGDPVKANSHASFCLTVSPTETLQTRSNSEPPADFNRLWAKTLLRKTSFCKKKLR